MSKFWNYKDIDNEEEPVPQKTIGALTTTSINTDTLAATATVSATTVTATDTVNTTKLNSVTPSSTFTHGVASASVARFTGASAIFDIRSDADNSFIVRDAAGVNRIFTTNFASKRVTIGSGGVIELGQLTVATLPVASLRTGGIVFVTDEIGGPTVVYSDGTNWRRVYDNAIAS